MDNLGITVWNDLVSPLFDASCTLRIINGSGDDQFLDIKKKSLNEKAAFCREKGIDTLICGAISDIAHDLLVRNGITVIGWIQGPVEEILNAFTAGEELVSRFAMPGCNQFRRHHCTRMRTGRKRNKGSARKGNGRGCGGNR